MGGATHCHLCKRHLLSISIHAPRGGSDMARLIDADKRIISIHAPRGGSDNQPSQHHAHGRYFNPRSPWGERLVGHTVLPPSVVISIHAPRGGSDENGIQTDSSQSDFNPRSPWGERPGYIKYNYKGHAFQSTLPVGGATKVHRLHSRRTPISIHAPRGGSDCLPGWNRPGRLISIHAPRGGSDHQQQLGESWSRYFNPRSPWGERL